MITPYDFGKHIGKQAFLLPAVSGIADGLLAPSGHRMEGVGRGVTKGVGGSVGSAVGVPTGIAGAIALALINPRLGRALFGASRNQLGNIGKKVVHKWNGTGIRPLTPIQKIYGQNLITRGGTAGAIGGGIAGIAGTSALMGKPSWESLDKQAARGDVAKALSRVVGINKEIKPFLNNGVPLRGRARASDLAGILANFRNSPMWARIRDTAMGDKAWEAKKLTPGNTTGALVLGKPVSPVQMQADNAAGLFRYNRPYADGGGSVLR